MLVNPLILQNYLNFSPSGHPKATVYTFINFSDRTGIQCFTINLLPLNDTEPEEIPPLPVFFLYRTDGKYILTPENDIKY